MKRSSYKINIGLVGCGQVAWERHLPALKKIPQAEVVAVADIDKEQAQKVARQFGIPRHYIGHDALLADGKVDAVGILTPPDSHVDIATAALKAQKHVLIEKPLALTPGACDQLIAQNLAYRKQVVLCHNLRWHRLIREAKHFINTGALGEVKFIHSTYTHNRKEEIVPDWKRALSLGGGITFHEGIHHFDMWRYLLGQEVQQVFAFHRDSQWFEDETSIVCAELTGGVLASLCSTYKSGPNSEVEIYGACGRLFISCYRFDGLEFYPAATYPGNVRDRFKRGLRTIRQFPKLIPVIRRGGDFADSFYGIWCHFINCIRLDSEPECTLEDGKRAIQIARGAELAFLSDKPARIT